MKSGSIYLAICLALISMVVTAYRPAAAFEAQAFDGVWRSRGYGWLWKISDAQVERFDIGEGFCIPSSLDGQETVSPYNQAELSDDRLTLRLRLQDPDYLYTFDRLPELPARCREQASDAPEFVFETVVKLFDAHYAFLEERGVDWKGAKETAKSKLHAGMDEAELLEVFEELLAPFEDSHVGIEADIDGEAESIYGSEERTPIQTEGRPAIDGAWNPRAVVASLKSVHRHGDDILLYGQLADDIGYLQVESMSGMKTPRLEAALDKAMAAFDGSKAVIVDVSENDGGLDSFARLIARRFAATPTVAYSKHAGDFKGDQPQEIVLQPPDRPRFLGPVYLITSDDTISAAEIFTMSMRALPNVVHLGETTDGSLSDELLKTLPNGWILSLSNEVYLDSKGVLWEGKGVPPQIPLAISEDDNISQEARRSVSELLEYIRMRL